MQSFREEQHCPIKAARGAQQLFMLKKEGVAQTARVHLRVKVHVVLIDDPVGTGYQSEVVCRQRDRITTASCTDTKCTVCASIKCLLARTRRWWAATDQSSSPGRARSCLGCLFPGQQNLCCDLLGLPAWLAEIRQTPPLELVKTQWSCSFQNTNMQIHEKHDEVFSNYLIF